MKIAVMSDLHDNVACWKIINVQIEKAGIKHLINCGDTCSMSMLLEMSDVFSGKIYTIPGNVSNVNPDIKTVELMENVEWFDNRGEITVENRKISFVHRPTAALELIKNGKYDLVCHGHTHLKRWEPFDQLNVDGKKHRTWVLNPGTAGGMFHYPTYAVVDLDTMTAEFKEVIIPSR